MLRFVALILIASTATGYAETKGCDRVRFDSIDHDVGLRHDKIVGLSIVNGNGVAYIAVIAPPKRDPGIREIMLAANLAGSLPLQCSDGPNLTQKPGWTCDMALVGSPLELVVTFAPEDAADAESRTQAVARYIGDQVLCPLD